MSKQARIQSIFGNAIAIDDALARERYLNTACDDPRLRESVQQLVDSFDAAGSFLELNISGHPSSPDQQGDGSRAMVGSELGPFTLTEFLGEGSFGRVYKATQQSPLQRTVAIKVVKPSATSAEVLSRFDVERQSLALMEHAGIAKVFSAHQTPNGSPYFAMEFVDGISITDFARQHKCSVIERLELVAEACTALQHAHEKGVIHRDIKPSNILVTETDGRRQIKLIDFGVSKILSPDLGSSNTCDGQLIGTPQYMSPEQAACRHEEIDFRSDIYSLGIVLFELLTGSPPDTGHSKTTTSLSPSSSINEDSIKLTGFQIPYLELRGLLNPQVDWSVQKATAFASADRYQTAAYFSKDLRGLVAGESIVKRPTILSRAKRPLVAAMAVCCLLALSAITAMLLPSQPESTRLNAAIPVGDVDLPSPEKQSTLAANQLKESRSLLRTVLLSKTKELNEQLRTGRFDLAEATCDEALKAAEGCNERDVFESNVMVHAGRFQNGLRNYAEAVPYFERAVRLADKFQTENPKKVFHSKFELVAIKAKAFRQSPKQLELLRSEINDLMSEYSSQMAPRDRLMVECKLVLVGVLTSLKDDQAIVLIENLVSSRRDAGADTFSTTDLKLQSQLASVYLAFGKKELVAQQLRSNLGIYEQFLSHRQNPFFQFSSHCKKENLHEQGRSHLTDLLAECKQKDTPVAFAELNYALGIIDSELAPEKATKHFIIAVITGNRELKISSANNIAEIGRATGNLKQEQSGMRALEKLLAIPEMQ